MSANTKLFLSAVSSEFESYRRLLAGDLKRPTLDVAVQEDFGVGGGLTLEKLDIYLRACDGVVHLIGKATGAVPEAVAVREFIAKRCPDTLLDDAWNNLRVNLVVIRGKGGEGKTALVAAWMAELAAKDWRGAERVLDWTFYSQGTRDQTSATSEVFIHDALVHLGDPDPNASDAAARAGRLAQLIGAQRCLLVLDGLEPLQYPPGPLHGALKGPGMAALLHGLAARNAGLCVVTTREKVDEIRQHYGKSAVDHELKVLSPLAGAQLLHNSGARRGGK